MADYTSPEDEAFFGAIGRLTVSWAHLEFGLDGMVQIMHSLCDECAGEVPRNLSRKIKYLRQTVGRMPIPQESLDGFRALLDKISSESERRHDIIHGFVVEHAERSGKAKMVRINQKGGKLLQRPFRITTEDILRAAIRAQKLGGKVLRFVDEIYPILVAEKATLAEVRRGSENADERPIYEGKSDPRI